MEINETKEKKEICESVDISLERIYYEMNCMLAETEYMDSSLKLKQDIFLKTFKEYLLGKINEAGITLFNEDSGVLEMVKFICDRQEDKERLYVIVNYMLSIISSFQKWEVVWEICSEFSKEERELQVHSGLLNKFATGKESDVYKSFAMLYCFFTDSLVLESDVKKLEIK